MKVGDRVKYVYQGDALVPYGCVGTIEANHMCFKTDDEHFVRFDTLASPHWSGLWTCYECDLAPLTNPDTEAWKAFKELLKPNPAILAARDPAKKQEFWVTP